MTKFFCPNCRVLSEKFEIEVDQEKRDKVSNIIIEIHELKSRLKKEERKFIRDSILKNTLDHIILNKEKERVDCETMYKYIECQVCGFRHYIYTEKEKKNTFIEEF